MLLSRYHCYPYVTLLLSLLSLCHYCYPYVTLLVSLLSPCYHYYHHGIMFSYRQLIILLYFLSYSTPQFLTKIHLPCIRNVETKRYHTRRLPESYRYPAYIEMVKEEEEIREEEQEALKPLL